MLFVWEFALGEAPTPGRRSRQSGARCGDLADIEPQEHQLRAAVVGCEPLPPRSMRSAVARRRDVTSLRTVPLHLMDVRPLRSNIMSTLCSVGT